MISMILSLGVITAISLLVLGSILLFSLKPNSLEDSAAQELEFQLSQAIKTTFGRILSASLQMIIYTVILLLTVSMILQGDWAQNSAFFQTLHTYNPGIEQLASFIIGGLMSIGFALALYMKPLSITTLLHHNKGTLSQGSSSIFLAATGVGFLGTGLLMLGIFGCMMLLGTGSLIGFGVGTLFSAFFLRLGGGLFKSATDISTTIIESEEKEIPSFDVRNPLTILNLSSQFISGLFGFSSDIVSSFSLAIIAVITLTTTPNFNALFGGRLSVSILAFGLLIIIASMIAAIFGSLTTYYRMKSSRTTNSLLEGLYICLIIIAGSSYIFSQSLGLQTLFYPVLAGIIGAIIVGFTAEILTSHHYKNAKNIAKNAEHGPAVTFLGGYSAGLMSTPLFLIYTVAIIGIPFYLSGIMGSMMAILGFLSPTAFILIMTAFKPFALSVRDVNKLTINNSVISQNAKKMTLLSHTTAAIGNGYAATAATLTAIGLLVVLFKNNYAPVTELPIGTAIIVFLMGSTLPALCNSILLKKLLLAIKGLVKETLRQFSEIPYLYEHKARPDVIKAADSHARTCMDALALSASLMVIPPVLLTVILGSKALTLYILGALLLSTLQTVSFANTGDLLNHSKHIIGEGRFGGKKAAPYAHSVVADTIGDAFKDLLSPNMNIMIKGLLIIGTLLLNFLI